MEEINLNFDEPEELEPINIGLSLPTSEEKTTSLSSQPSVNSGGGLELLMNEKRKDNIGKSSSTNNLENELLNDLDNSDLNDGVFDPKKDITINEVIETPSNNEDNNTQENIGISTIKIGDNRQKVDSTWDGYKSINKVVNNVEDEKPVMTKQEMLKEKFNILRKLENLERKGVQLTKKYSMESNLMEMKGEYENIVSEKEKKNSVKFQGKVLTALITGIEFLNGRFDPFDLKLDGWSEQLNENLEDYDEIFGELYEKYKSKASMSPEMKLIFQLAASGMMIHMTNTMFKSAVPGMDDIMRQNPDLMQQFTSAAMNSMNQTHPGTSKFMNEFSNNPPPPRQPVSGNSFMRETPQDILPPQQPQMRQAKPPPRREMKGPSGDLSSLLSGLKKKPNIEEENMNNDSIISLEDLNNLEKPKKVRRRKGSEKNTLSLDI
tara:strand:+ start:1332 stop:2636 length:1305 start_codon:yes stop_codon:yes gene_type:complete